MDAKSYEISNGRPIFSQHGAFKSLKEFDWRAAGTALAVCGMALLYWLNQHFVDLPRYERDQLVRQEAYDKDQKALKESLGEIKTSQHETQRDVQRILERSKP